MPNCPLCQTALEDDFGLIDCPGCNAPLFIDIDGQVVASSAQPTQSPDTLDTPETDLPQQEVDQGFSTLPHEPVFGEDHFTSEHEHPQEDLLQEDPPQEESLQEEPPKAPEGFVDLSDFANSSLSQGKDGLLRFNILIEGIDSVDLRHHLSEALEDKKLIWDKDELLRSIDQGRLMLKDVPAVKAVLLIRRLRERSLQISWEQYAIHQI